MCRMTRQEEPLNDLENPLLSERSSSEWYEDEGQFSLQKVNLLTLLV